ncbi:phosphotriesterase-related protein-like [Haliotis asinina]|uniref:phosphotriesterase-related protein-like n=1 Tax=Haliotis asinina TaxID=109174 RepID=UPI00353266A5
MPETRKGMIQTVTGLLLPDKLGVTLTHEHLWIDSGGFYVEPDAKHIEKTTMPLTLPNYGWITHNPYSHKPNLNYGPDEIGDLTEEMMHFKNNGGCSIVENTTIGLYPNVEFLKDLSEATGVNIVAGAGYYVGAFQTESTKALTSEAMADCIRHDVLEGVGKTGIKCGVIGEIGCAWPLEEFERRSLQASAVVQSELDTPVIIHPGRNPDAPFEILRIFQEAGGKLHNVVMSHLDRTFLEKERLLEFATEGVYCEYDLFGIETSHYQPYPTIDMPSDAQRIQMIKTLVDNGYEDKICIAQDIHTKHRLTKYGGHGFSHALVNIVPKMLTRGISQEAVNKFLIDNPKRWLTYLR